MLLCAGVFVSGGMYVFVVCVGLCLVVFALYVLCVFRLCVCYVMC